MFAICKAGFLTILLDLFNSISTSSFKFRLRVLVTIATSRGLRRTVSSKWLEHATDGWSCPAGVQGEGVQLDRVAGHPVILQEKHREVCNLNSRSNKRVHNKICPTQFSIESKKCTKQVGFLTMLQDQLNLLTSVLESQLKSPRSSSRGRHRTVSSEWLEHALNLGRSKHNNRQVQDILRIKTKCYLP